MSSIRSRRRYGRLEFRPHEIRGTQLSASGNVRENELSEIWLGSGHLRKDVLPQRRPRSPDPASAVGGPEGHPAERLRQFTIFKIEGNAGNGGYAREDAIPHRRRGFTRFANRSRFGSLCVTPASNTDGRHAAPTPFQMRSRTWAI
jgi:hypothetical protein